MIVDLHLTNNFSSWTSPMPSRRADPSERARLRAARVIWHSPLYLHPYNVTMCGRTNPCSSHIRKSSLCKGQTRKTRRRRMLFGQMRMLYLHTIPTSEMGNAARFPICVLRGRATIYKQPSSYPSIQQTYLNAVANWYRDKLDSVVRSQTVNTIRTQFFNTRQWGCYSCNQYLSLSGGLLLKSYHSHG